MKTYHFICKKCLKKMALQNIYKIGIAYSCALCRTYVTSVDSNLIISFLENSHNKLQEGAYFHVNNLEIVIGNKPEKIYIERKSNK